MLIMFAFLPGPRFWSGNFFRKGIFYSMSGCLLTAIPKRGPTISPAAAPIARPIFSPKASPAAVPKMSPANIPIIMAAARLSFFLAFIVDTASRCVRVSNWHKVKSVPRTNIVRPIASPYFHPLPRVNSHPANAPAISPTTRAMIRFFLFVEFIKLPFVLPLVRVDAASCRVLLGGRFVY